jgi:ankyrin repeat protein
LGRETLEIMQWLINHGANPSIHYKDTPLHSAAIFRQLKSSTTAAQCNVRARDRLGQTLLHYASEFCCPDVACLLPGYGADVNARDNTSGSVPLHLVPRREAWVKQIYEGRIALARLLFEHGADICAEDNKGITALQVASEEDDDEMMQLMSEHIAN